MDLDIWFLATGLSKTLKGYNVFFRPDLPWEPLGLVSGVPASSIPGVQVETYRPLSRPYLSRATVSDTAQSGPQHLFMYIVTPWKLSSLVKCLFTSFAHFTNWVSSLSFENYIFKIQIPWQIFFHLVACLFMLVTVFHRTKVCYVGEVQVILSFLIVLYMSHMKSSANINPGSQELCLCFPLEVL